MGFSLADPTQKEAFYITLISAFAAAVFWALSLYEEHHQRSVHASVISFSLSSFIDLFSTAFVLWRFCSRDALAQTVENSQAEARAAVAVSLALLALAVVDTSFAVGDLAGEVKPTRSELYNMVLLSLPSQAVYLTVGMLQLQAPPTSVPLPRRSPPRLMWSVPSCMLPPALTHARSIIGVLPSSYSPHGTHRCTPARKPIHPPTSPLAPFGGADWLSAALKLAH